MALFWFSIAVSQDNAAKSKKALAEFKAITAAMNAEFPEDKANTFRRSSFTDKQLQSYLSQHFQRLDLLPKIEGQHALKLNAYNYSGNWFLQIGFPRESIKCYDKFFKYYEGSKTALTATELVSLANKITYSYASLAKNLAEIGDLASAQKIHKDNIAYAEKNKDVYYPSALNNYGLYFYWYKKDLDSAAIYFNTAYEITKQNFTEHTIIGSIRDNIADLNLDKGRLRDALSLYEINFEFYKRAINENTLEKDYPRLISAGSQVVSTSAKLGDLGKAEKAFDELRIIVEGAKNAALGSASSTLGFLEAKEQLLFHSNKLAEAYQTTKTIRRFSDSLNRVAEKAEEIWRQELNDVTLDRVALNFEIDKLQTENKIKKQRSRLWISGLLSSVFIIILLFLFLSRRQRLINAKNEKLLAEHKFENSVLKVKQLNSEIESKKRDLTDFAISLTQNQDWIKDISTQFEQIKASQTSQKEELLMQLEHDIANKINYDDETKIFFERLAKLSDTFYKKLNAAFPNLSKNEINLCSLIRLKIESRSIATLQNITLASLNTSRYRLRKKLDLSEATDLDIFIQNL